MRAALDLKHDPELADNQDSVADLPYPGADRLKRGAVDEVRQSPHGRCLVRGDLRSVALVEARWQGGGTEDVTRHHPVGRRNDQRQLHRGQLGVLVGGRR